MSREDCELENYDFSEDTLLTVIDCAEAGIASAIKEYNKRKKELDLPPLDTVSGKALDISQIRVDWIEE
jgi:hypothetical protein